MTKWTKEEDHLLLSLRSQNPSSPFTRFTKHFPGRSADALRKRYARLDPSVAKGKWGSDEKQQLFEKAFEMVEAGVDRLVGELDVKRARTDVDKEVRKLKACAAERYLGVGYEVKGVRRREVKRDVKRKEMKSCEGLKMEENCVSDMKENIKNQIKDQSDGLTGSVSYSLKNIIKRKAKFANLPNGLSRDDFLKRINSLPSTDQDQWIAQEDQNLLQLYQQLGPSWTQISVFTDGRNAEQVKQRFCSLLSWGAYNYQQQICAEDPLNSRKSVIDDCVGMLIKELSKRKKAKDRYLKLINSIKFEHHGNASCSDDSLESEFSY